MYRSTVQESEGGLVLTVPDQMKADLNLSPGNEVEMEFDTRHLLVRSFRPRFTLQELLDQCDPTLPISDEDKQWEAMTPIGSELL